MAILFEYFLALLNLHLFSSLEFLLLLFLHTQQEITLVFVLLSIVKIRNVVISVYQRWVMRGNGTYCSWRLSSADPKKAIRRYSCIFWKISQMNAKFYHHFLRLIFQSLLVFLEFLFLSHSLFEGKHLPKVRNSCLKQLHSSVSSSECLICYRDHLDFRWTLWISLSN